MKRLMRCISLVLVAAILLSVPVFAQEEAATRSSAFFRSHMEYLYQLSSTKLEVWFDVTSMSPMDELGVSKIEVQRSINGTSGWSTMKTYNKADYSQMVCKNTSGHVGCVTYTGTSGFYYRALVTYYAKNSSGTAYYNSYTSVKKLTL